MSRSGSRHAKRKPIGLTERETIVIATEGEKTEPDYFIYLQRKFRRANIEIVPRDYSCSDPMRVLEDLIEYKNNEPRRRNNTKEHWIVIDINGRCSKVIEKVVRKAVCNGLLVADSNPCFELWLLLHRKPLSDYTDDLLKELQQNERIGNRTRLEVELVKICGEYNKSGIRESDFLPYITIAIQNAYTADIKPNSPWILRIGSRVYKLVESILGYSP